MSASIIGMIGVICGIVLQFLLSKRNEIKKQRNLLKFSAYADLIKGLAGSSILDKNSGIEKQMESKILIADAKARICIFGDDSIIEKIAYYLRMSNDCPDSEKTLVDIIVEIRRKHNNSASISVNDISQLILGIDIEKNKKIWLL